MSTYKEDAKVRLYASLVKAGRRTIEQVPKKYREAVLEVLKRPHIY